jgi:hypothetical protein
MLIRNLRQPLYLGSAFHDAGYPMDHTAYAKMLGLTTGDLLVEPMISPVSCRH